MENIKNFVNGIVTGNGNTNLNKNTKNFAPMNMTVPNPDKTDGHRNNHSDFAKMASTRNRTDSESSNVSVSSISSNNAQKDKDPYFWVM